jgi:type VI protein secretion system component Hcp
VYICNVNKAKQLKQNIMNFLQITKAINFTQTVLKNMLEQGLASDKYTFSLCRTIQERFGATENDALIIIETSLSNI